MLASQNMPEMIQARPCRACGHLALGLVYPSRFLSMPLRARFETFVVTVYDMRTVVPLLI